MTKKGTSIDFSEIYPEIDEYIVTNMSKFEAKVGLLKWSVWFYGFLTLFLFVGVITGLPLVLIAVPLLIIGLMVDNHYISKPLEKYSGRLEGTFFILDKIKGAIPEEDIKEMTDKKD